MEDEKMSRAEVWFEKNVVDNTEEIAQIGELAARMIADKLRTDIEPATTIATYGVIFESILRVLSQKQNQYKSFSVNICDCISVSYNNYEDTDAEKNGNFAPFIQQIATGPLPDTGLDVASHRSIELLAAWNNSHVSEQPDVITEIASDAVRHLYDELGLKTMIKEAIMPIFCVVHDCIITWLKMYRVDTKAMSAVLHVCGLYTVTVVETTDGDENVEYECHVFSKKNTKDDYTSVSSE